MKLRNNLTSFWLDCYTPSNGGFLQSRIILTPFLVKAFLKSLPKTALVVL